MRVHHLITKSQGGAANATAKVHSALRSIGVESEVFFSAGAVRGDGWRAEIGRPKKTLASHLLRLGQSLARTERTEQFSLANNGVSTALPASLTACDILQIHWLGDNVMDLDRLSAALPRNLPVVWRLADLNAITAICHYPGDCRQYLEPDGCRCCPFLRPGLGHLLTRASFAAKQRFFENHPVHLVAISDWELDLARQSALGRMARSITLIYNPFKPPFSPAPLSREEARRELDLEANATWLCYGADNAYNPRKGVEDFIASVPLVRAELPGLRIALVGDDGGHPGLRGLTGVHAFGRVTPAKLESIFAACDGFAMPTHEEALGQMGLEAISQGTPTVCYADSGPCSYVLEGITGHQVPERSAPALAQGLLDVLNDRERYSQTRVRRAYDSVLREKFAAQGQAKRYLDLYRNVCR